MKIGYLRWDNEDFIITINKEPIGKTVTEFKARIIVSWLKSPDITIIKRRIK